MRASVGENYWYDKLMCGRTTPVDVSSPIFSEAGSMRRPHAPDAYANHFNVAKVANELNKLGFTQILAAYGQREGLAAHWEMDVRPAA